MILLFDNDQTYTPPYYKNEDFLNYFISILQAKLICFNDYNTRRMCSPTLIKYLSLKISSNFFNHNVGYYIFVHDKIILITRNIVVF